MSVDTEIHRINARREMRAIAEGPYRVGLSVEREWKRQGFPDSAPVREEKAE